MFKGKKVIITGGTGSLGKAITKKLLLTDVDTIRIFSRDEWKQVEMQSNFKDKRLRFLIGDVRDKERLRRAMRDVDIVIHTAALKHVSIAEYNPFEAIKTNVMGSQNVVDLCLENNVDVSIAVGTDKAVAPLNTYGATKLLMERIFISANYHKGNQKTKFFKRNIAIIGAGIAGCSLAKKLNDKGYQVTIFEKNKSLDTGPSAYKALVMYPRLSAFDTPYSLFCLHSYLYSTKFYDALNTSYWNKTGVLLLDFNETTHKRFLQILNSRQDLKLFKKVTRDEATEISGIPVPYGGLFFKDAGWLNPNGILKHMLNSPRIKLITGEVTKISKTKVFVEHKDYSFDHICLCSSFESNKLINLKGITKKRGQITYLKKELDIANLKIPICAQGYISPTSEDVLITGSTYSDSDNEDVTLEENLENIERLKLITDQKVKVVDSNFGYRSTTPDRLPLLGKSEDIFINISHGSRGTTSAPISAQFICDLIDGSPPVFGKRLIRSLNPERFTKKS